MCGIFGCVATPGSRLLRTELRELLKRSLILSESRGKDASGFALLEPQQITVLKQPVRAKYLVTRPEYKTALDDFCSRENHDRQQVRGYFGHARMVTNGSEDRHENNQPVIKEGLIGLHNGIITNDATLWDRVHTSTREFEVDTEVLLGLIGQKLAEGSEFLDAFEQSFKLLEGANSVALLSSQHDGLMLASSNGSLFLSTNATQDTIVFASEKYILEQMLRHPYLRSDFDDYDIMQVTAGSMFAFSFRDLPAHLPALPRCTTARCIEDVSPAIVAPSKPRSNPSPAFWDEMTRFWDQVNEAVHELRRCTKCLLPETFPFIQFDEQGVCNYCRNFEPQKLNGADELAALADRHRRSNGQPDCLVAISGGRDSSYGLHYIREVLGMNPVAYTYDWGMVTDLARRNISRMCGALGVEHILVSADIRGKRENIRKNVTAWLKQPDLGTVPLFMAGDKQFFWYAAMLRRQMDLGVIFFNMNPLERTDFKVGFCGIDENYQKEKHYNLSWLNKIRLAAYYGRHFLSNPAFLNATLRDSAFAFFSYYLIPKDYITLYDYIPWDEATVEHTILTQYGWEVATDTETTWRIGDGTASFYNYIYYVMAGFSENDSFRSNQIRQGMMTRATALARVNADNQPRYDSIQWYCDTIGVDVQAALRAINAAPRLYIL
jgi:glucosamine--fructose-6-phosphate aminotransferase (isomerizing)